MIEQFLYFLTKFFTPQLHKLVKSRIEENNSSFYYHHERPKYEAMINTYSDQVKSSPKLGIIIQGPIDKDNDFTLETIKIYKKLFQNTEIILSTWEDEDKSYLDKFTDENINVVLSKKPDYPGVSNVNFQIVSSSTGIVKAKELGAEYCLKTRTDQRMYAPNIKEFLINLLKTFPVNKEYKQKERIIGASLNTFKYRLYGLSDMFCFGNTDDMLLYWTPELDTKEGHEINGESIKLWCSKPVCEVYFCTEFLRKIGRTQEFTLEDNWNAYVNHFCIVDKTTLDLIWDKYDRQREHRYTCYDTIKTSQELDFKEWLNLYVSINNKENIPENILELKFDEPLT